MSVIHTTFAEFFANATVIITNAHDQPEIAAALEALGYDAAVVQQGRELLTTARALYDAQIRKYGEQHAATQAFITALKQADKTYTTQRRLAGLTFKGDAQRQTDFHLNQARPRRFNLWYQQSRHFYTALLADALAQTQLARYKITPAALQAGQAQVELAFTLNSIREQRKGEAQNATRQRDLAIKALARWLSDFKAVARIALADAPPLLEALNLNVIA